MMQADKTDAEQGAPSEREAALRAQLADLRDELAERDERFALLEAEMWAAFEAREARHRQLLEEREQQLARARACEQQLGAAHADLAQRDATIAQLTETSFQLHVRLQRIHDSPPARLYRALIGLPGLRWLAQWRAHGYAAALRRYRPS